jgi:hypothetical protein
MPAKMNMLISNGNFVPPMQPRSLVNHANLASIATPKAPSALNASIISRIHSVRPGCGSCGRH